MPTRSAPTVTPGTPPSPSSAPKNSSECLSPHDQPKCAETKRVETKRVGGHGGGAAAAPPHFDQMAAAPPHPDQLKMAKSPGWQIVDRVKAGELLVFDGGYGTALFDAGLLNGACPEVWNDSHADVVRGIHQGYFDAGSDFVETNTFGGTRLKLNEYRIGDRTRELNVKGARLARAVCPPGRWVAGSIGPTSCVPA